MIKKPDGTYLNPQGDDSITDWGDPNEWLNTRYGRVMYKEWCEKEAKRMTATGKGTVEVGHDNGKIALVEVLEDEGSENNMQQEA